MRPIALLVAISLLAGCADRTEYGVCVGLLADRNPALEYKLSKWNAFVSFVFFETVIVPIWWAADDALCPYQRKGGAAS